MCRPLCRPKCWTAAELAVFLPVVLWWLRPSSLKTRGGSEAYLLLLTGWSNRSWTNERRYFPAAAGGATFFVKISLQQIASSPTLWLDEDDAPMQQPAYINNGRQMISQCQALGLHQSINRTFLLTCNLWCCSVMFWGTHKNVDNNNIHIILNIMITIIIIIMIILLYYRRHKNTFVVWLTIRGALPGYSWIPRFVMLFHTQSNCKCLRQRVHMIFNPYQ